MLDSKRFAATVRAHVERFGRSLILVDPYYAFHGNGHSASDLHQEGALLTCLSQLVLESGSSGLLVNHFNKTGSTRQLGRITMAGSGEWSDSWILVSHRADPRPDTGDFSLSLEVGSRQWGGQAYDVEAALGIFDSDLGEHADCVQWRVRLRQNGISE